MLEHIKECLSLLVGLLAWVLPEPIGGGVAFRVVSVTSIALGIIVASLLFYLKGNAWLSSQFTAGKKSSLTLSALLLASLVIYLALYLSINTPSPFIVYLELLTYCIATFLLSALFSLISVIATDRSSNK